MPYCPNCGSYVSPGSNVCSCGTTFSGSSDDEKAGSKSKEFEIQEERKRNVRSYFSQKIKKLMDEGKYLEAIEWYDGLLEISYSRLIIKDKAKAYYYGECMKRHCLFLNSHCLLIERLMIILYGNGLGIH